MQRLCLYWLFRSIAVRNPMPPTLGKRTGQQLICITSCNNKRRSRFMVRIGPSALTMIAVLAFAWVRVLVPFGHPSVKVSVSTLSHDAWARYGCGLESDIFMTFYLLVRSFSQSPALWCMNLDLRTFFLKNFDLCKLPFCTQDDSTNNDSDKRRVMTQRSARRACRWRFGRPPASWRWK